jgi:hypothetical protein
MIEENTVMKEINKALIKAVVTTILVLLVSGCLLNSKHERPDWSLEYSAILSYASAFPGETEAGFHSEVINELNINNIDYMVHCRAMTTISIRKDQEKNALLLLNPIINKYLGRITIRQKQELENAKGSLIPERESKVK